MARKRAGNAMRAPFTYASGSWPPLKSVGGPPETGSPQRAMELNSIYDNAPIGLAVLDTQLRYLRINKRLAEINGLTVEEHIGRSVREILPDIAPQAERVLQRILETGQPLRDVEIRGTVPSEPGVERVWREQFTPMRDEGGDIVAISIVAEEVTAQRRLEQALRQYRERLDIALEAGRMGVWEWMPSRDELLWSPQMFLLAGLPPAPGGILGFAQFMALVDADDRASVDAQFARVLERGGEYEVEFRIRSPEGRERWLLSRGRAMHDAEGRGARVVGVSVDVTERKTMEQALRDGDARRNEFLAMLGHELRNPLAPITNAVRLLEKMGADTDSRTAAVQIIRRQSQHMARLVDDLLEVSRITQGRIELRMENLLVATSVYSAIEAARPLARQKQHRIDVSVPPDLDLVADPARLTQILSNLLVNAVKYTPPGGRIEVHAGAGPDGSVEIRVRDNGNGISAELLPRVFELFTQDRRTLERSEGGLGLGLALVKRLVELHGGSVEAESPGPGRGATFTVRLPQLGRREELRPSPTHPRSVHVSPLAVLIVDDNRDSAETLAALLRLDGHRVAVAFDGPEALEAAAHERPDFVLLDIGLPRMNGLEVARRMRQMAQLGGTRVIGMSGYAQESDRAAAKAAGFDAHLAKPADLADVYRVMEELLNA
jgi:two-component system CheB/CheR fusion protein